MIIYYIKNKLNGKLYIGQSKHTLKYRLYRHAQKVRQNSQCKLYQAIRKYGWENFECQVICHCSSKQELDRLETYYINKYDTYKNGYNMTLGGDVNFMDIDEYRKRHDEKMRTSEVRNKISNTMQQIKSSSVSEETRQKLSNKLKGNKNYLYRKIPQKVSVRCYNKQNTINIIFKNRTQAAEWWKQNGNPKGLTKRYKDLENCILNKICINGLYWEIYNPCVETSETKK